MFTYQTDQNGIIIGLNEAFIAFAKENWRPDFNPFDLLGKPLMSEITDPTINHLYSVLLEKLRQSNQSFTLPFRCDSPAVKRHMVMTITPEPGGIIQWNSRILKEEPRESVPLLDVCQERAENFVKVCSWCKQCRVPDWLCGPEDSPSAGCWIEVEHFMPLLGGRVSSGLPAITHTACPDCYEKVMSSIERC